MKEGLTIKARRAKPPVIAKRLPGARPSAKPMGGVLPAAKPLPAMRKAPASASAHPLLKPLKDLQPDLSGASGHPKPTPAALQHRA